MTATAKRSDRGLGNSSVENGRLLQRMRSQICKAMRRRAIFRRTLAELGKLSNQDLKDLGIPRSGIRRLALEAAVAKELSHEIF